MLKKIFLAYQRSFFFLFMATLTFSLLSLGACSTTDDLGRDRETSIPWNRPASWEGPGVLGSNLPQNSY